MKNTKYIKSLTAEELEKVTFRNKEIGEKYIASTAADNQVRLYSLSDDSGNGDLTISEERFDADYMLNPEVGMGCTECLFSDSHACTITKVSPSGKTIWYRRDKAKVVKGSCQDGSAEYEYSFDESGYDQKATLRKDGRYRATGTNFYIALNCRVEYYDPHF